MYLPARKKPLTVSRLGRNMDWRDNRRNKVAKNNYRNMYVHETVLFLTNSPTPRTMAMYPTTATTSQVPRRMESTPPTPSDADIVFVSLSASSFTEPGVIRKRERRRGSFRACSFCCCFVHIERGWVRMGRN